MEWQKNHAHIFLHIFKTKTKKKKTRNMWILSKFLIALKRHLEGFLRSAELTFGSGSDSGLKKVPKTEIPVIKRECKGIFSEQWQHYTVY